MFRLLVLSLFLAAAAGSLTFRHRYQLNEYIDHQTEKIDRGGRIVGGTDRTIEQHPYQIGLFFNRRHTCGGSVLSANTVLSAAHCTHGRAQNNFQSLAGQTDIRNSATLVDIIRIVEHPNYDDWTLEYDVVVMRLASSYVFGPTIRAVVLPPSNYEIPDNDLMFVTGWGSLASGSNQFPNILQGVQIPKWTNERCDAAYPRDPILGQHLCGGEIGRDSCQGDSGGPVTHNGFQVGIVSWGIGCAGPQPGVNARVSFFLSFITQEINRA